MEGANPLAINTSLGGQWRVKRVGLYVSFQKDLSEFLVFIKILRTSRAPLFAKGGWVGGEVVVVRRRRMVTIVEGLRAIVAMKSASVEDTKKQRY